MESPSVLLDLFVLFAAAKVLGEAFEYVRQPAVVGELLAGVIVGPHVLAWVAGGGEQETLQVVAELGVIILLFTVGLEVTIGELRRVGRPALLVGVFGVILPFVAGAGLMGGLGHGREEVLFVGAALVATSVGITARVLRDLGVVSTRAARVILGAAVVDDILAILVLAVVSGLAQGTLSTVELTITLVEVLAFLAFAVLAGPGLIRRLSRFAHLPGIPRSPFVFAVLVTLGMAALAEEIGLAAIIGAFLAGSLFEFSREEVTGQVQPVYDFLVPFFFAFTGTLLDPGVFANPDILGLASVVTVIAVATKIAGGWLGSAGLGRRTVAIVGVGMVPRGEVGLIVASLGLSLGVISTDIFGVVLAMTVVTTLVTPPVLGRMIERYRVDLAAEEADQREAPDGDRGEEGSSEQ